MSFEFNTLIVMSPVYNRLSIVIPTLNEESRIGATLRSVGELDPPACETIVVDCGSEDQTVNIARAIGATVIQTSHAGRSVQMNEGAKAATGHALCFLHADTLVPNDLVRLIDLTLANSSVACGGFISLMTGPRKVRWFTSLHNFIKTYYAPMIFYPIRTVFGGLRCLFGDQAMFCRREDFWNYGPFDPGLPIMEDADLCLKLNRRGRIRLVKRFVRTSDRRLEQGGSFKMNMLYMYIGVLWGLGVPAARLKRYYDDVR